MHYRKTSAWVLGLASGLALPPFSLAPVLFVAFPAFLLLLDGAMSRKNAFALGFWFGFGHFLLVLHWIVFSLFTDIGKYWAFTPLAFFGPALVLAPLAGLAALAAFCAAPARSPLRGVFFALAWSAGEWLRGHILTGFPWMPVASAWDAFLPMLQSASVWGAYGRGLVTLLLACLPHAVLMLRRPSRQVALGGAGLLALLALAAFGELRLASHPASHDPRAHVRIVQPGIEQDEKGNPDEVAAIFRKHLELSALTSPVRPNIIVWPETAILFPLDEDEPARAAIAGLLPPEGLLLSGTIRREMRENAPSLYFNSLAAINSSDAIAGSYDKFRLVPFGEYMPLRNLLPLSAIAASNLDFSRGGGPRTLHFPGMPSASPLICYEAIFPGGVVAENDRPDYLLAITNDGWFGHSPGPYQHFSMARMRSIEEGLPTLRAANTGISGIIDPLGRVEEGMPLGQTGVLDGRLPKALPEKTPYAKFCDLIFFSIFTLITIVSSIFQKISRQHGS